MPELVDNPIVVGAQQEDRGQQARNSAFGVDGAEEQARAPLAASIAIDGSSYVCLDDFAGGLPLARLGTKNVPPPGPNPLLAGQTPTISAGTGPRLRGRMAPSFPPQHRFLPSGGRVITSDGSVGGLS